MYKPILSRASSARPYNGRPILQRSGYRASRIVHVTQISGLEVETVYRCVVIIDDEYVMGAAVYMTGPLQLVSMFSPGSMFTTVLPPLGEEGPNQLVKSWRAAMCSVGVLDYDLDLDGTAIVLIPQVTEDSVETPFVSFDGPRPDVRDSHGIMLDDFTSGFSAK